MPKISVIVPVYNVEKYLSDCLDSILNQTFADIEVICVNDGSTDSSRKILTEYEQKDKRIKIIDKENGGLSSARNAGMKVATGDFISFVDSDDWIDKTMLEKLYNNITSLNTDIAICGVHQYDETNQKYIDDEKYFSLGYFDNSFDNRVFSYEDTTSFIMDVCVMAWNKLYRRSFLKMCNASFPDGLIFEDGPFFFSIYFKTQKVSIVRDLLYYYRINRPGSIVQRGGKQFLDIIDAVELMYNSIKNTSCFEKIKDIFYCRKADDIIFRYDTIDYSLKDKFSKKLRHKIFMFDPVIFDFETIQKMAPLTYKYLMAIREKNHYIKYNFIKFKRASMYKIMEILYTEKDTYCFKFNKFIWKIKKRDSLYNIWYSNDKIFFVIFGLRFNINFPYSKLEPQVKKRKPIISVIVPVYNVEGYLAKCLDSILNQTFSDIEVICVNDGSTDNSRYILEEYRQKDSRIEIIDKNNGGLSSARNAGMRVAMGDFISFIDSDDWVDETMLEKLYNNITSLNTDIAICGVHQYDETQQKLSDDDKYFTLGYFNENFDNRVFSYEDTTSFMMDVCVMAWNKLYRRSFLEQCEAKFPEGLIFEDGPFFFSIYFKTKRVSIVRELLYYYRIKRLGSIVQKGGKPFLDIIDVVELMFNSIKDLPCFNKIKNDFYIRKADDIIYRYYLSDILLKRKFSKRVNKMAFMFDHQIFDFDVIRNTSLTTYKTMKDIKDRSSIFSYYLSRFKTAAMYKIMEILYTEENIYYFKYRKIIWRIKKRANICDVWYANDRIFIVLFGKLKINFKFEYSELEQN